MKLGVDDINNEKVSPIAEVQPKSEMVLVSQMCKLMDIIMSETQLDAHNFDAEHMHKVFIFAVVWGLGACIQFDERPRFNKLLVQLLEKNETDKPNCKSLFELYVEIKDNEVKFSKWTSLKTLYVPPIDGSFAKILVPTEETVKYQYLARIHFEKFIPICIIGESGVSKTVVIKN